MNLTSKKGMGQRKLRGRKSRIGRRKLDRRNRKKKETNRRMGEVTLKPIDKE